MLPSPPTIGSRKRRTGAVLRRAALTLGLMLTASILPLPADAASIVTTLSSRKIVTVAKHAASALLSVVNQKDILPFHQALADQVLRALPPLCRNNLRNFYVNYTWKPENRGLGGETTIIVTGNVQESEFRALVIHECGHITDLGGLLGFDLSRPSMFADGTTPIYGDDPSVLFYQISWLTPRIMQPGATVADFVSGYATTDPFEDFAETYAYYVLQQKEFAKLAMGNPILQDKYDFMSRTVFAGGQTAAEGRHKRGQRVPWDVTRLPYVWHAERW